MLQAVSAIQPASPKKLEKWKSPAKCISGSGKAGQQSIHREYGEMAAGWKYWAPSFNLNSYEDESLIRATLLEGGSARGLRRPVFNEYCNQASKLK